MIKVSCGYEGCDWSSKYSDVYILTSSRHTANYSGTVPAAVDNSERAKNILHSDLLKHLEEKHGIPPAIWER